MKMPYCRACAARVPRAGWRMMLLFSLVTIAAAGLPAAAAIVGVAGVSGTLLAAAGAGAALLVAIVAALLFLPPKPRSPATARGEAVSVTRYNESDDFVVFCTNGAWAERLAAANQTPAQPATRLRLVESIAVGWTLVLAGGMTFMTWYAAEYPAPARPPTAPAASARPGAHSPAPPATPKRK